MRLTAKAGLVAISLSVGLPLAGQAHAQSASSVCKRPVGSPHPHGFVRLLDVALSGVDLSPNQTTAVDEIAKRTEAEATVLDEAKKAVLLALADQIETGRVDISGLKSQLTSYIAAREILSNTFRTALQGIHQVLDPEQRTKFANSFEERFRKEAELYASPQWLDAFGAALKLSDEQKQKIRGVFENAAPSLSAELQQFDKALSEFKGENFSLAQFFPLKLDPLYALESALRMVQTTSKITEILTPEQRALAAKLLRHQVCEGSGQARSPAYDYPYTGGFGVLR